MNRVSTPALAALSIAEIFAYILPGIKSPSERVIDVASYTASSLRVDNSLYDGSPAGIPAILIDPLTGKPATAKVYRGFIN